MLGASWAETKLIPPRDRKAVNADTAIDGILS